MTDPDKRDAILREFARIGLRSDDLPGLATSDVDEFLEHLRRQPAGASWRDVLPDLPAHWVPGRPETWTTPYRPLGPYDYQELPTGPAVHVVWPKDTSKTCLDDLVVAARRDGWPVHGAGFLEVRNPKWRTIDAFIVLARGTGQDTLGEFVVWLEEQPAVGLAAIPRCGDEEYIE